MPVLQEWRRGTDLPALHSHDGGELMSVAGPGLLGGQGRLSRSPCPGPRSPHAWLWAVSRASSFAPAGGAGFPPRGQGHLWAGRQAWQGTKAVYHRLPASLGAGMRGGAGLECGWAGSREKAMCVCPSDLHVALMLGGSKSRQAVEVPGSPL